MSNWSLSLYQVFVDLIKSFDIFNGDAFWIILGKIPCQPIFVNIPHQLHRDMQARVVMSGRLSDEIPIDNGVKPQDVLAPTLFSIFFSVMLTHTFQHCERSVVLEFRTRKVFDLGRFNFKLKTFHSLIREFLYADAIDFLAHTADDMQHIENLFADSCCTFGLKISLTKTSND